MDYLDSVGWAEEMSGFRELLGLHVSRGLRGLGDPDILSILSILGVLVALDVLGRFRCSERLERLDIRPYLRCLSCPGCCHNPP